MHFSSQEPAPVGADASPAATPLPEAVYRCFLFTDIEGSTSLWERYGESFREALDLHHSTIRAVIREHGGQELVEAGDGFLVSFVEPRRAVTCAVAAQQALARCEWPVVSEPLRIRMGLHAGEVEARENGEYRGIILNRAARVRDTAHGEQIVCSEDVARAMEGIFTCRELGRFRLKGLPSPERLFQVDWPGMPDRKFPAPNAVPAYTHNLPHSPTRFFGRTRQIAAIRDLLLAKDGGRLLTLTGPGGTGKTRLSLAAAESLLTAFSHAVFFIPLADTYDADAIPREIVQALRLDPNTAISPEEQIATFFGQEPALLVFDNFEQLAEAGARVIQKLLASVPRLRCLITSRHRLNLPGEREFPVPPLAVPDEAATPEELADVESVQLFVDRAQVARASFELHERNAAAVAELCRRLDGVPLAVELAAARADVSTPQEILGSLGSRLDALAAADTSAAPARHRTLRAAIDWSFEFLPPALREFFVNLAVFRGGWTAEGAEAVASVPALGEVSANILRALSELRSASLVTAEESGDTMRFRMLETLRQYAEERLQTKEDADVIINRHRLFYLAFAETSERELLDGDQIKWLERVEAEHENIRVALANTDTDHTGLRIASSMVHFWTVRGYLAEGREHLARHMAYMVDAAPLVRLSAVGGAGSLAWMVGDLPAARAHFEHAVNICRESKDELNLAAMLANIGFTAIDQQALDDAEKFLHEALQLYTELGVEKHRVQARHEPRVGQGRAQCLIMLAHLANEQSRPSAAKEHAEQALAVFRQREDWNNIKGALSLLAAAHNLAGDHAAAHRLFCEAIQIIYRLGDPRALAVGLGQLSVAEQGLGNLDEAVRLYRAADWIAEQSGVENLSKEASRLKQLKSLRDGMPPERFEQCWKEGQLVGRARLTEMKTRKKR
ncbi:ATP-binding protein [Verrucomicrobiota bacterium sgz303538]